jgi:predicted flap endonuclease-1-like 5' DNA nuclease
VEIAMEVGLFVLGALVGVGLAWYLLERYRRDETEERQSNFDKRVAALQEELRQSDAALAETKDRLIALQMEHRAAEGRTKPLQAELAQAKRAAEQAVEQEMRQRELAARLQDELAAMQRGQAPAAPAGASADALADTTPAPAAKPADDLTAIRGIGKVIERKLHGLGITSFGQIAAMTAEDARRVNEALEFPGRVEREHWVE